MTEEKTCYNCGNKNCHIFYYAVKQDVAEHHETYEYTDFDCVNHDKWEELKVEEIRTDNTETLKNALERIKELEKEKCELLGIIQGKDKVIKDLEWQSLKVLKDNDNYQTDIDKLEEENAELKERNKAVETTLELHSKFMKSKLTEAKNHIHRLLVLLTEGKRSYAVIDEARAFLQEESE